MNNSLKLVVTLLATTRITDQQSRDRVTYLFVDRKVEMSDSELDDHVEQYLEDQGLTGSDDDVVLDGAGRSVIIRSTKKAAEKLRAIQGIKGRRQTIWTVGVSQGLNSPNLEELHLSSPDLDRIRNVDSAEKEIRRKLIEYFDLQHRDIPAVYVEPDEIIVIVHEDYDSAVRTEIRRVDKMKVAGEIIRIDRVVTADTSTHGGSDNCTVSGGVMTAEITRRCVKPCNCSGDGGRGRKPITGRGKGKGNWRAFGSGSLEDSDEEIIYIRTTPSTARVTFPLPLDDPRVRPAGLRTYPFYP